MGRTVEKDETKDDILPIHPSKNVIFSDFCPKIAIFDIFGASKDDILPLLLSDIKQRRHLAHSSIKNDIFCPKNDIFGDFCPKMAIFDIFGASKDDILPLLLSDIKQKRHFTHSSIKNDIFA